MKTIQNLRIIKDIFDQYIPNHPFCLINLWSVAKPNNIKNYYIGDRIRNYKSPEFVDSYNMQDKFVVEDQTTNPSIFQHTENDYYYYDVLDHSERCEKVCEGLLFERNACNNLQRLDALVLKYKKEER